MHATTIPKPLFAVCMGACRLQPGRGNSSPVVDATIGSHSNAVQDGPQLCHQKWYRVCVACRFLYHPCRNIITHALLKALHCDSLAKQEGTEEFPICVVLVQVCRAHDHKQAVVCRQARAEVLSNLLIINFACSPVSSPAVSSPAAACRAPRSGLAGARLTR